MTIKYCDNYDHMSQMAFDELIDDLTINSKQLVCLATGNSPKALYKKIVDHHKKNPVLFNKIEIIKLDEWEGIESENSASCENYLRRNVLTPLNISNEKYISFKSNTAVPEKECARVQKEIEDRGPIGICILGLGKNGHVGFNEPSDFLTSDCHVAHLSESSLNHEMIVGETKKPEYGLTLGIGNIMQSEKIILLITGHNKKEIMKDFLAKKISTKLPASFLWMHPNVSCYIDSKSLM